MRLAPRPQPIPWFITCVLAAALLMTGCATAGGAEVSAPTAPADASASDEASAVAQTPAAPPWTPTSPTSHELRDGSPVGEQLAWVFERLDAHAGALDESQMAAHFDMRYLMLIPPAQLKQVFGQLAPILEGAELESIADESEHRRVALLRASDGTRWRLTTEVDEAAPHRITGILVKPAPDVATDLPASWEALFSGAEDSASQQAIWAAEVRDGQCVSLSGVNEARVVPIGSAFKLYVLLALVEAVEAGETSWDAPLTVRDAHKSLPEGLLHEVPDGAQVRVEAVAGLMMASSDNTAADMLIHHLGRDRVEAVMRARTSAPERNTPLLTTREVFALKSSANARLREAYLSADAAVRRVLLDGPIAHAPVTAEGLGDWSTPRDTETIEWFASPRDLCETIVTLREHAAYEANPPLRGLLSHNPGVQLSEGGWHWASYKGGSEPGVLNMTYLLERADGRIFFFSLNLNDPSEALSPVEGIHLSAAAINLLAEHR